MAKETKEARTERLVATLRSRAETFRESDETYREFLKSAVKFHRYSLSNQWLISVQRPGAIAVNSFKKWIGLGRCVRKGETAIYILAPRPYKKENRITGKEEEKIWFTYVPVFDYSQTEPLEDAENVWEPYRFPSLTEDVGEEYVSGLIASLTADGNTIERFEDERSYRGRFHVPEAGDEVATIAVRSSMPMLQQLSTLVHELAHFEHWRLEPQTLNTFRKGEIEFVAESASFAVLSELGFDASGKSVAYIGAMLGDQEGGENKEKALMGLVVKVVDSIMGRLQGIEIQEFVAAVVAA